MANDVVAWTLSPRGRTAAEEVGLPVTDDIGALGTVVAFVTTREEVAELTNYVASGGKYAGLFAIGLPEAEIAALVRLGPPVKAGVPGADDLAALLNGETVIPLTEAEVLADIEAQFPAK